MSEFHDAQPDLNVEPKGVWVAYTTDMGLSDVVIFETEVEALRQALADWGHVAFVEFGKSVRDVSLKR